MNYTDFGLMILVHRKRNGISQETFAGLAQISRNYLSLIERSQAENLSVDVLVKLAGAMQSDPCELLRVLVDAAPPKAAAKEAR